MSIIGGNNMWCPICDVVELERPILKETYEEIEKLLNDIINETISKES